MLNKETTEQLKRAIKDINKEKDIDTKLTLMINLKEETRNLFNDFLDDIFAEVNLTPKKINLEDDFLM